MIFFFLEELTPIVLLPNTDQIVALCEGEDVSLGPFVDEVYLPS